MATEIKIVTRGGRIVSIIAYGLRWPLKKQVSPEDLKELCEALRLLSEYIDLDRVSEGARLKPWSDEKLRLFLQEMSELQRALLRVLAERGELSAEDLLRELIQIRDIAQLDRRMLTGALADINRRARLSGREPLIHLERMWVDERLTNVFKLNPHYREIILEFLESE